MSVEKWVASKNRESGYFYSLFYPRKHRAFEALGAGVPSGHPLASACCIGIVTATVTTTTPSTASAATMAIIAKL
jgi:hypothetical protein